MSDLRSFNYKVLNDEARIVVQQHTSEIRNLMSQTARDIIDLSGAENFNETQAVKTETFENSIRVSI